MKIINIQKVANVISIFVVFALVLVPLLAGAQFRTPSGGPVGNVSNVTELIMRFIQILLAVAGLVAVIFLIIGGFRYITAGGNEETSESAKKTVTNAIIGIVIVILAFVIVRVISNALTGGAV